MVLGALTGDVGAVWPTDELTADTDPALERVLGGAKASNGETKSNIDLGGAGDEAAAGTRGMGAAADGGMGTGVKCELAGESRGGGETMLAGSSTGCVITGSARAGGGAARGLKRASASPKTNLFSDHTTDTTHDLRTFKSELLRSISRDPFDGTPEGGRLSVDDAGDALPSESMPRSLAWCWGPVPAATPGDDDEGTATGTGAAVGGVTTCCSW